LRKPESMLISPGRKPLKQWRNENTVRVNAQVSTEKKEKGKN